MYSPKTLRSSHTPTGKEKKGPIVFLYKIDFPDNPGKRIKLPKDINELLKVATEVLELTRPAKQIFDENHEPITDIADIENKSNLYISCATPTIDVDDEPLYKSRLPKNYHNTAINLPLIKQPEIKPKREDSLQHQAIAASPNTVKENVRDSLLALYSSLSPEHKAQHPYSDTLQKMTMDTAQSIFEDSLMTQFIGPSSVIIDTPIGQLTNAAIVEKMRTLPIEECKFAIIGPVQSGKSTVLNMMTSIFYQKLLHSQEITNYLVFPINWLIHQIYLDDIPKIYELYIETAITSLKSSHMEYIPILSSLQQWFLSLITIPAFPPLPPIALHFPDFPVQTVTQVAREIHDSWNKSDGFSLFLEQLTTFPTHFAHAFGFTSAVYIFDSFESCGFRISPTERFSASENDVLLSELVCKALQDSPYFVASHDDRGFFNIFNIDGYRTVTTERLINFEEEREIFLIKPSMSLNIYMCHGCPAYCAIYTRLCDMIESANQKLAIKSQFFSLKSTVDSSRKEAIRRELFNLCLLLAAADNENLFDDDNMNVLMGLSEVDLKVH